MEEEKKDVQMHTFCEVYPESRKYSVTEVICAFLSLILAFLYTYLITDPICRTPVYLLCFTGGFLALGEILLAKRPRSRESTVWLFCILFLTACILFGRCRIWTENQDPGTGMYIVPVLLLHAVSVWWVLSRSGSFCEDGTGHLLLCDILYGLILLPFGNFFLRVKVIFSGIRDRKKEKAGRKALLWSLLAVTVSLVLFSLSTGLLSDADDRFAEMVRKCTDFLVFDCIPDEDFLLRFFLSLPVGAFLYGLLAGSARADGEVQRKRGVRFDAFLQNFHQVPASLFTVLLGAFVVLYAIFFFLQGRYLFGAFLRMLPEGFKVAQYARQGFFELCKVIPVNFALLWIARHMSRSGEEHSAAFRIMVLLLLAESFLLGVTALSKLILYIDCFGFTAKRLLSSWLVLSLMAASVLHGITFLTGKKTFRIWFLLSALLLTALHIY